MTVITSSSASSSPTRSEHARQQRTPITELGLDCQSLAGSPTSTMAASSLPTAPMVARVCLSTCRSYDLLRYGVDDEDMFDISPDHAIGLYAGLVALPIALIVMRLMPAHRAVPGTVR